MGQNSSVQRKSPDPKEQEDNILLKLVLLGDTLVGKTPLRERLVNDKYKFQHSYHYTVGVDFGLKTVAFSESTTVKVQIWEIAGVNRWSPTMLPVYLRGADGALLVCDVTNQRTLDSVPAWKDKLDSSCKLPDGSPVPCLLLANKIDLAERREVSADSLHEISTRCGCVEWREVSVKDGTGVNDAFQFLLRRMLKEGGSHQGRNRKLNVQLDENGRENVEMGDFSWRRW